MVFNIIAILEDIRVWKESRYIRFSNFWTFEFESYPTFDFCNLKTVERSNFEFLNFHKIMYFQIFPRNLIYDLALENTSVRPNYTYMFDICCDICKQIGSLLRAVL